MTEDEKKARIRELNDELRTKGTGRNGRILIVGALARAGQAEQIVAMRQARLFNDFNSGNDPHGEHDMGQFKALGQSYMFKIDYYALDEMHGSEHPEDPNVTIRVMSIMYAEDY